jgi:TatD DNase family protein
MSFPVENLPALDCHAHIAEDVTRSQLSSLGNAHIFAMTRSLQEASTVLRRRDRNLTWGLGIHPAVGDARAQYDPGEFRRLLPAFALVGEVGLDKRGPRVEQERILVDVLQACKGRPVLISLHSTGRTREVIGLVTRFPHPGAILHWFLGTTEEIEQATELGVYFSVNAAMPDELLKLFPRDRVLPETDFPARTVRAKLPGAVAELEVRLASIWGMLPAEVRLRMWKNLRDAAVKSGAIDAVSEELRGTLRAL